MCTFQSFRFLFIIIVCIYVYQKRQILHEDGSAIRRKGRYSEDDDYVAYEYGHPRVKQNENGLGENGQETVAPGSGQQIEEKL